MAESMGETEFQKLINDLVENAREYLYYEVSPERERALTYYKGSVANKPLTGRSKAVTREVFESISGMLPDILHLFTAMENPVEFIPLRDDQQQLADQQTEFVNKVFLDDLDGFTLLYDFLWDAFVTKICVAKTYWDETKRVEFYTVDDVTESEYQELKLDDDIEITEETVTENTTVHQENDEFGNPAERQEVERIYDLEYKKIITTGKERIDIIPPEDFIVSRRSTGPEDSHMHGEDSYRTVDDLVAMGYDREEIMEMSTSFIGTTDKEDDERDIRAGHDTDQTADADGMRWVRFIDIVVKIDYDGDGVPEWRHVIALGDQPKIYENDAVNESPYDWWSPIRIPHSAIGMSIADTTTDLQDQNTALLRGMLDNIYLVNTPRQWSIPGLVNQEDIMDFRFGTNIRTKQKDAMGFFETRYTAANTLNVMQYLNSVRERRTGHSDAAMGLDPNTFQKGSAEGVSATMSASRVRVETIARLFAENFLRRVFKKLLQVVVDNDTTTRQTRLFGNVVEIPPDTWNIDFDLKANIGLGRGTKDQRVSALGFVIATQKEAIAQMGPVNALTSLAHMRYTIGQFMALSGLRDSDKHFFPEKHVAVKSMEMMKQREEQMKNRPDPEKMKMQIEQQKLALEKQKNDLKIQLERERASSELEIKRLEGQQDMELAQEKTAAQMELERKKAIETARLDREIAMLEHELNIIELKAEIELEPLKMALGAASGQGNIARNE